MRVRVSPIPPPQWSRGKGTGKRIRGTVKNGAREPASRCAPVGEVHRRCGSRWGELRVADAPGIVSRGRCREARFPNGLFARAERVRLPPGALSSRTSFNGRTAVFQTADAGSIPAVRSASRFSDEDRGLQNRARGFDSLSALHAPLAQRKGHRLLSDPIQVRLLGGALVVRPRRLVAQDFRLSNGRRGFESRWGLSSPCLGGFPSTGLRSQLPRFDSWQGGPLS